jgi:hypothetical protein
MRVFGRETHVRNESERREAPLLRGRGCTVDRSFFGRIRVGAHMMGPERCRDLCLHTAKPEETLVEARSDSDVQIDRLM